MDRVEAAISESPTDHSDDASTFFIVAREQPITRAMWRNPVPSLAIRRHCSACSWLSAGGRPIRFSAGAGPVQSQPDPLAGRIHLVGSLSQHRAAEELGRGASLPGVDVFPNGHDADVTPSELRLDADAVLEVPGEPVQKGNHDRVSLLDLAHQLLPAGTLQVSAARHVGEDQVGPDAVLGQEQSWVSKFLGSSSALPTRA